MSTTAGAETTAHGHVPLLPTDAMTEAARVAIATRFTGFNALGPLEQYRVAHMAMAAGLAAERAATDVAHDADATRLRTIIGRVVAYDWIIGSAYDDATHRTGWQVNVRDGKASTLWQDYRAVHGTFALDPVDAGLKGLAHEAPLRAVAHAQDGGARDDRSAAFTAMASVFDPMVAPMRQPRGCECHGSDDCPSTHPPREDAR